MSRCNKCGHHFRTMEGEEQDHPCPRCGWFPWDEEAGKPLPACPTCGSRLRYGFNDTVFCFDCKSKFSLSTPRCKCGERHSQPAGLSHCCPVEAEKELRQDLREAERTNLR